MKSKTHPAFERNVPTRIESENESEKGVVTMFLSPDGAIEEARGPVSSILGYEPAHLKGSPLFRYINDGDLLKVFTSIAELVTGYEKEAEVDLHIKTADGKWHLYHAIAHLRLNGSTMTGIMLTLYPIMAALAG